VQAVVVVIIARARDQLLQGGGSILGQGEIFNEIDLAGQANRRPGGGKGQREQHRQSGDPAGLGEGPNPCLAGLPIGVGLETVGASGVG